jgi:hypothetical protein
VHPLARRICFLFTTEKYQNLTAVGIESNGLTTRMGVREGTSRVRAGEAAEARREIQAVCADSFAPSHIEGWETFGFLPTRIAGARGITGGLTQVPWRETRAIAGLPLGLIARASLTSRLRGRGWRVIWPSEDVSPCGTPRRRGTQSR